MLRTFITSIFAYTTTAAHFRDRNLFLGPSLGYTELSVEPAYYTYTSLTLYSFNKRDSIKLTIDTHEEELTVRGGFAYVSVYNINGVFQWDTIGKDSEVIRTISELTGKISPGDFILYALPLFPLFDSLSSIEEHHLSPAPFQTLFGSFRELPAASLDVNERERMFSEATPPLHIGVVRVSNVGSVTFEQISMGRKYLKSHLPAHFVDKYSNVNHKDYVWLKMTARNFLKVDYVNALVLFWRPSNRKMACLGSLPMSNMEECAKLVPSNFKSFKLKEDDYVISVMTLNPQAYFDVGRLKKALLDLENDPYDSQLDLLLKGLSGDFVLFAHRVLPLPRRLPVRRT